ncbi:metal-dependent hydrolase (plasmid) [Nostoc sp. UHCC 0926]|uniref:metal-dependent hydrolase n=1 Tax=Nostoc sp. UHCC 0926 TaxID=3025190 RepID=UPI002362209B|nr:metal-dependent hydrolase [Nostoc sp. UHCC 0926]WDD30180.1 metal-dependent hydrolase [Nostoc sp. UHCC 0926]
MEPNFDSLKLKPFNPQKIQARKIKFQFSNEIPRLWHDNSLATTHFLNAIGLFLPGFEAFMVRGLKTQLSNINDSELESQIYGFIGQEANHGKAHNQYNQILRQQGYKFDTWLKVMDFILKEIIEKRLSSKICLAAIAGFEHLTTLLAGISLKVNLLEVADYRIRPLWEWHAVEEIEHSSLAFNLLQEIDNSYWLRALGGLLGAILVFGFTIFGMLLLFIQERDFFSFKTLIDLQKLLFTKYKLIPYGWKSVFHYFKFDFHPNNQDILLLAENLSLSLSQT